MERTRTKRMGTMLLAVTLAGGLAACGDDDDSGDAGTTTTTTAPATATEDSGGDAELVAACDAYAAIPEAIPEDGPPEDPEAVEALLADLEAGAPDAVATEVETVVAAMRAALGGDPEALNDDVFAAYGDIGVDLVASCPADEVIEVTAVDYAFEGAPDTLPAGRVNALLTNASEGGEEHEMIIVRKADGVTESFDEILAMSEEESESLVEFSGAAFAPPGGSSAAFLELAPGEYVMACFIPVGGGEDGPPHFTQGMKHEFTVE